MSNNTLRALTRSSFRGGCLSQKYRSNHSQAANVSFEHPDRRGLFYHLLQPPTPSSPTAHTYAVSFLKTAPPNPESPTVIGWLPADIETAPTEKSLSLREFRENARFKPVLHETIYAALRDDVDEIWINAAKQLQNGWMHVHDQRNPPPLGRIGDPDDIIASVLVENGTVKSGTYQPMPSYRVCTADGITLLTPGLMDRLMQSLTRIAEEEKANVNP